LVSGDVNLCLNCDERYKGKVKNGLLQDKNGVIIYKNGIKDKGNFENGSLNGQGIRILPDGTATEGTFEKGDLSGIDLSTNGPNISNMNYKMKKVVGQKLK
jgi:hypothetical protein